MVIGVAASSSIVLTLTFRALSLRPHVLARALARPVACAALVALALVATLPLADALAPLPALAVVVGVASGAFFVGLLAFGRPLVTPIWGALRRG